MSMSLRTISKSHHSMANVKIYKCLPRIYALALTVSEVKIIHFLFSKSRSRIANVKATKVIFTFFIIAKIWPVRTKVTEKQTDIHRNEQSRSYRRNIAYFRKIRCRLFQQKDYQHKANDYQHKANDYQHKANDYQHKANDHSQAPVTNIRQTITVRLQSPT